MDAPQSEQSIPIGKPSEVEAQNDNLPQAIETQAYYVQQPPSLVGWNPRDALKTQEEQHAFHLFVVGIFVPFLPLVCWLRYRRSSCSSARKWARYALFLFIARVILIAGALAFWVYWMHKITTEDSKPFINSSFDEGFEKRRKSFDESFERQRREHEKFHEEMKRDWEKFDEEFERDRKEIKKRAWWKI